MIQPNAGLPRLEGGETVFDVGPEEFARWGKTFLDMGGRHPGGLLRHHTDHIRALAPLLRGRKPRQRQAEEAVSRFCGWQGSRAMALDSVAAVGSESTPPAGGS